MGVFRVYLLIGRAPGSLRFSRLRGLLRAFGRADRARLAPRQLAYWEQYVIFLSSVYSIIAADIGYEDKAVELYERSARLDLDNYNNDTNDGLHITSMTGSWLAIVQGFAGMRVIDDELQFSPFVPKDWEGYNFRINFRDRLLEVTVNKEGSSIKLLKGDDLTIKLNGESLTLTTEK